MKNRLAIYFGVRLSQETDAEKKELLMKMMEATQEGRSLVLEMKMAGVKRQKTEDDNKLLNRADQVIQESNEQQAKPK